jgi:hypothetical protein
MIDNLSTAAPVALIEAMGSFGTMNHSYMLSQGGKVV